MTVLRLKSVTAISDYTTGQAAFATPGGGVSGNMLAGVAFPTRSPSLSTQQEASRLADTAISTSQYGQTRTIGYGTFPCAGNLFWTTDLESQGTKGKGSRTVTESQVTPDSKVVSAAWGLCEGPVDFVRRIWANDVVIYDAGENNTGGTVESGLIIRIYLGTETQQPDPHIEAEMSPDPVPAYRGTCYFVIENADLAKYSNTRPNMRAEVVRSDLSGATNTKANISSAVTTEVNVPLAIDPVTEWVVRQTTNWEAWDTNTDNLIYSWASSGQEVADAGFAIYNGKFYTVEASAALYRIARTDPSTGLVDATSDWQAQIWSNPLVGGTHLWAHSSTTVARWDYALVSARYASVTNDVVGSMAEYTPGESLWTEIKTNIDWGVLHNTTAGTSRDLQVDFGVSLQSEGAIIFHDTLDYIVLRGEDSLHSFSWTTPGDLTTLSAVASVAVSSNWQLDQYRSYGNVEEDAEGHFWLRSDLDGTLRQYQASSLTITSTYDPTPDDFSGPSVFDRATQSFWNPFDGLTKWVLDRVAPNAFDLGNLVQQLVNRHGVTEVDATELNSTIVRGFFITRPSQGRVMIEILQQGFLFDSVETGGQIVLRFRDRPVTVSVLENEIGARAYPGRGNSPDVRTIREEERRVPYQVTINYSSFELEYETANQYARKFLGPSREDVKMEFPLVMSHADAAQLAEIWLMLLRTDRTAITFTTDNTFLKLDPSDIITVTAGNIIYAMRITRANWNNGIITLEGFTHDQNIFSTNAQGVPFDYKRSTLAATNPLTEVALIDLPPLRNTDDQPGHYLVYDAITASALWNGVDLRRTQSGGTIYNNFHVGARQGNVGTARNALDGSVDPHVWDRTSVLRVTLLDGGALASETEANVLNGSNAMWTAAGELIQFTNATYSSATNEWTLTDLLRGRKGTEWAMGLHAAGEEIAIVSSSTAYRVSDSINVTQEWTYAPVSFGRTLAQTATENFTNTQRILRPYSPCCGKARPNPDGSITLDWIRRARLNNEWLDSVDVPVDENSVNYEVDIYASGQVLRTIAVTSVTAQYTGAQQEADSSALVSYVSAAVYQISDRVGRSEPHWISSKIVRTTGQP